MTRRVLVEVELPRTSPALRPGLAAEVTLPTGPPTPTRKGGSFLVRPGMRCSGVVMI